MSKSLDKAQVKAEADRIATGVAMLSVEMVNVDTLKPYANNSKIHDKNHIQRLAANIKREGLQDALLVEEDGTIVAGHGRWESVKTLGWEQVPVRVMRGYSKAQCMLHRVSSNLTVSTKYDSVKQSEELAEIQALLDDSTLATDLAELTGYSERDIEVLTDDISVMDALDDIDFSDTPDTPSAPPADNTPVEEAPQKMTKLGKLFGFDEVTTEQAKAIRKFIAICEIDSPDALTAFCNTAVKENDDA